MKSAQQCFNFYRLTGSIQGMEGTATWLMELSDKLELMDVSQETKVFSRLGSFIVDEMMD